MNGLQLLAHWTAITTLAIVCGVLVPRANATELPDFATVVEQNRDAVVNVSAVARRSLASAVAMRPPEDGDPPKEVWELESGSGFVISSDGYVLTSAHVVEGAVRIVVATNDGQEHAAALVGIDPDSDVALLKTHARGLPSVRIGDSSKLRVGDWVLAIGSPFGLEHSATQGIVSALGRTIPTEIYVPYIQTDVAVNPGNSGGPLFNADGEVVGINTQILSPSGQYIGISFAVPIDHAMRAADQLKTKGRVSRGWLGVAVHPVTQALADLLHLDKPQGAFIIDVAPGGPAEDAGLKRGDLILEFGGRPVEKATELFAMVASAPVGQRVAVVVRRDGENRKLPVTIRETGLQDALESFDANVTEKPGDAISPLGRRSHGSQCRSR